MSRGIESLLASTGGSLDGDDSRISTSALAPCARDRVSRSRRDRDLPGSENRAARIRFGRTPAASATPTPPSAKPPCSALHLEGVKPTSLPSLIAGEGRRAKRAG